MKNIKQSQIPILSYLFTFILVFNVNLYSFDLEVEYKKAIQLSVQGLHSKSDSILKNIINKSILEENYNKALDSYTALGYNQLIQENFIKSMYYYAEGIKFTEKQKGYNFTNLNYLYKQYAYVNSILNNHIIAIEYYDKAKKIALNSKDYKFYHDLGISSITSIMYLGEYERALKQLLDLEIEIESFNNSENKLVLYLNLLDCFYKLNKSEDFNVYFKKVTPIIDYINDIDYKFSYELLKAQKYLLEKDTNKAINQFVMIEKGDWGDYNINFAKLEKLKTLKIFDTSKINFQELISLELYFSNLDNQTSLIDVYNIILSVSNDKSYLEKYNQINKNYFTKNQLYLNQALELNEKLQNEIRIIMLKQQELEYQKQKYMIVAISLGILLIISVILVYYIYKNKKVKDENLIYKESNISIKTSIKDMILEIQTQIFTNDIISKEYVLNNILNNLINYHKQIKE